jgi:hypothetical protein
MVLENLTVVIMDMYTPLLLAGGLTNKYHFDEGSLYTMVVMLSRCTRATVYGCIHAQERTHAHSQIKHAHIYSRSR